MREGREEWVRKRGGKGKREEKRRVERRKEKGRLERRKEKAKEE